MSVIVPTITAANPAEFSAQLSRLNFAPRLHIDITDGDFAPSRTVNLNQIYWDGNRHPARQSQDPAKIMDSATNKFAQNDKLIVDLHLMMKQPGDWLHQIVALNPNLVILHAEIDADLPKIFAHLRKFGIKVGVALLPETAPETVRKIVEIADQALVFGGHLGFQGGTADLKNLEKVAQIREIWQHAKIDENSREIAWDGGANAENVAEIARAGVDVINVGAAIAKSENPEKIWRELSEIVAN